LELLPPAILGKVLQETVVTDSLGIVAGFYFSHMTPCKISFVCRDAKIALRGGLFVWIWRSFRFSLAYIHPVTSLWIWRSAKIIFLW
jgi:hypothetical protein